MFTLSFSKRIRLLKTLGNQELLYWRRHNFEKRKLHFLLLLDIELYYLLFDSCRKFIDAFGNISQ